MREVRNGGTINYNSRIVNIKDKKVSVNFGCKLAYNLYIAKICYCRIKLKTASF